MNRTKKHFDCVIIGCGLAGLTAGITCASEGLKALILSGGMNALHFSSGSLDVYGYTSDSEFVNNPFTFIEKNFNDPAGKHPYNKLTTAEIEASLEFIKQQVAFENLHLFSNGRNNHFHVTGIGSTKPAYLSQRSVYNEKLMNAYKKKEPITILNFDGFRDYFSEITIEQMKKTARWKDYPISHSKIKLPHYTKSLKNAHEFRSIDLARIFDNKKYLPRIAKEIKSSAGSTGIISLPAFLGIENFHLVHERLEELTGLLIYEVPTLPPSLLGMRLDRSLRRRFLSMGGVISAGSMVSGAQIENERVGFVYTENTTENSISAQYFILATGSFLSGGLHSEYNKMYEPVFDLMLDCDTERKKWYSKDFFDKKSHSFLSYGVKTNNMFTPYTRDNKLFKNLFACGSILSHYNPITEGSGSGVAIATGYNVARQIIQKLGKV